MGRIVRRASFDDLDALLALLIAFHEHLQVPISNSDPLQVALERLLKDPMCDFMLATDTGGTGLAYTQIRYFYSLWSLGLEAKLEDLYVQPEVRRQKLGSQLLSASIEQARQRQCRLIALNTNEKNIIAKNLYIRQGFSCQPWRWQGGRQLWLEKSL
ncbi:GNAT family N-acetyltransferase [Acaryochloris sp. IP29b_bin.148]|uniref:GNAT family N-acetyltransferase n=1 Tax=Acaryochloris sp. IP29b_bin.148 TaxID=2969218 RepID=UPI002633DC49|nr:GNAT family N-acetyltransferase [Acaryochloris sp. IP29b_bin.148]